MLFSDYDNYNPKTPQYGEVINNTHDWLHHILNYYYHIYDYSHCRHNYSDNIVKIFKWF